MISEYELARLADVALARREAAEAHCAYLQPTELAEYFDVPVSEVVEHLARAVEAGLISVTAIEIVRGRR